MLKSNYSIIKVIDRAGNTDSWANCVLCSKRVSANSLTATCSKCFKTKLDLSYSAFKQLITSL